MKMRISEFYAALRESKVLFLLLINIFSIGIEVFFYNGTSLFAEKYSIEYLLGELENQAGGDGMNHYVIELPERTYVGQVELDYRIREKADYTVSYGIYNEGEYDNYEDIKDNLYPYFNKGYTNVCHKTGRIKISMPAGLENQDSFRVGLTNRFSVDIYRILFFDLVFGLLLVLFLCRKKLVLCLEYIYLLFALGFGIWMVCLLPLGGLLTWDNEIHFQKVYFISQGRDVEITEIAQMMIEREDYPKYSTYEEKKMIFDFVNSDSHVIQTVQKTNSVIPYNQWAYCASALGMKIGEMIHLPFGYCVCFAKLMNLLQYVFLIFLAIHFSKINKILPFVCGSIPTLLFQAASFSYDAYTAGFLILGITLLLGEIFAGEVGMGRKRIFAGILAVLFGCFAKAVYIPIMLLVLLIPGRKVGQKGFMRNVKAVSIIIMCIVLSTFVTQTVSETIRGGDIEGDSRGGNTNVSLQLKGIMRNPLGYGKTLLTDMGSNVGEFLGGWYILGGYPYFDDSFERHEGSRGNYYYAMVFLIFFIALTIGGYEKYTIKWQDKWKLFLIMLSACALIWTAMYLSFTPVGMTQINGAQPRYYLPMYLLFLACTMNRAVSVKWSENKYCMFICLVLLYCQAGGIYNVMMTNTILAYPK